MDLTTKKSLASGWNVWTAPGEHSADLRFCNAWKKDLTKFKYTQNIFFPEPQKVVETTHPVWSYLRVTQPMQIPSTPEYQKCNLLYKKN